MIPNVEGTRTEMHGAASIQNAVFSEKVEDSEIDKESIKAIVDKINALSVKYGGLGTATTIDEALDNLEAVIVELQGE